MFSKIYVYVITMFGLQRTSNELPLLESLPYFRKKISEYSELLYFGVKAKPHEMIDLNQFLIMPSDYAFVASMFKKDEFARIAKIAKLPPEISRNEFAAELIGFIQEFRKGNFAAKRDYTPREMTFINEIGRCITQSDKYEHLGGGVYYEEGLILLPKNTNTPEDKSIVAEEGAHLVVVTYKYLNGLLGKHELAADEVIGTWARKRELEQLNAKEFSHELACFSESKEVDSVHKGAHYFLRLIEVSHRTNESILEIIRKIARTKIDSQDQLETLVLGRNLQYYND